MQCNEITQASNCCHNTFTSVSNIIVFLECMNMSKNLRGQFFWSIPPCLYTLVGPWIKFYCTFGDISTIQKNP